ncbi:Mini-chromosome maintenance complex-binding protein [Platanthera zijinensis]|uniref:Mini-chromosome maintenance complex-binding protein n=1 Tax=Platanthera zijinensis TaxID=2320716 RepID=A0AAP0BDZ9_9ASPA
MVGLPYDCVANPHGAVRLTFEKTVAGSPEADPVAKLCGKDWGVVHLFQKFLFEEDGLSRVPILDQSSLRWIKPNTLVRFRGMVQDMLGKELYIGAFKAYSTILNFKYLDMSVVSISCDVSLEPMLCDRMPENMNHLDDDSFSCLVKLLTSYDLLRKVQIHGENHWNLFKNTMRIVDIFPELANMKDIMDTGQRIRSRRNLQKHLITYDKLQRTAALIGILSLSLNGTTELKTIERGPTASPVQCFEGGHLEALLIAVVVGEFNQGLRSVLVACSDGREFQIMDNDELAVLGITTIELIKEVIHAREGILILDASLNCPQVKVPRLHSLVSRKLSPQDFLSGSLALQPLPSMMREIRESLLVHLSALMGNDKVAAQFLLLHLLSRVRGKVDVVALGKLSLNLTGFTRESASVFGNRLNDTIMKLLPFSKVIPISVEYLNTAVLQPRKNNQSGRLVTGVLQLAQGTHLTIDETHLETGMLNSVGVENASLLRHLLEWQTVEYDFEYYKIGMAADVQILIFSEGKSNILPADLVLPFQPHSFDSVEKPSSEELQTWRWYLATAKSLPYSNAPEVQQILQDEIVAAMQEDRSLGYKDLSRLLTMAQLLSASSGETSLSLEQWQNVKELERLRKERLK